MALYLGTAGAVQDARAGPSTGFRPPFGLGRVTLERPKVTKGLLPRQAVRCADTLGSATSPMVRGAQNGNFIIKQKLPNPHFHQNYLLF